MFFIDLISLFVFVEMQDKITGTTSESTSTSFTLPQTSIRLITERDQTPTKLASDNVIRIGFGVKLLFAICLLLFHVYKKYRVKKNHIKMTEKCIFMIKSDSRICIPWYRRWCRNKTTTYINNSLNCCRKTKTSTKGTASKT